MSKQIKSEISAKINKDTIGENKVVDNSNMEQSQVNNKELKRSAKPSVKQKQITTQQSKKVQKSKSTKKEKVCVKTAGKVEENVGKTVVTIPKDEPNITKEEKKEKRALIYVKFIAAVSYIFFFIPLFTCKNKPFALYHANQSLWVWMFLVVLYLGLGFIPAINPVAVLVVFTLNVIYVTMGIIVACRGKARPLPLIPRIAIIKWY